jgi:hypothetical protein
MQLKPLHAYLQLGCLMQMLVDARPGISLHGEKLIIHGIREFLGLLKELNFHVSLRLACRLKDLLARLEKQNIGDRLSEADCEELSDLMVAIRNTVGAEAEGFELFATTPKRLDVEKLLNNPAALLPPTVFTRLPSLTKYDLSEAAKCLAFERPTAAAFHVLRATENVLREFYRAQVKTNRIKTLLWGPIVEDLQNKHPTKKKKIPNAEVLLNQLDYIRKQFRNPTQHPDKIYDIDEVQELWSLCTDVISRMSPTKP